MKNQALIYYTLHLADNALILGHQNSEWTGHGPILEQDIALSNISLDLIGQARNFYQYAARLMNESDIPATSHSGKHTEDTLAFLRDGLDYKNCLLVEQPNGDWAKTMVRQFFFSTYQFLLFQKLKNSADAELAAIAEKSLKETTYHLRWSSEWVIRLGDGTAESQMRIKKAISALWKFTGELITPVSYENELGAMSIAIDVSELKEEWTQKVDGVFEQASLSEFIEGIDQDIWMQTGGKEGKHTEHLGYILAEMQFMQRAYPGCEW